ncbi:hypothetical protein M9H77_23232 [Catharanthus roseus]|uniref:Uncharacterized protein n=1 Tax=Catharanthus roseus TaxID=4058 RepID=A0ACC0ASR1_CATRO|nr:hypothetical protein M9H77_23232 [Catharanthus roseus]
MNRTSQSPLDLKLGLITRAQRKKLKLQEDNGMISYMEETLKSKIEEFGGQGKPPKFFIMCSIVKEQSREQLGVQIGVVPTVDGRIRPGLLLEVDNLPRTVGRTLPSPVGLGYKILNRGSSIKGGDLRKDLDPILKSKRNHIKVVSEQPLNEGLIMSKDGHMPTQSHQEGNSEPSMRHVNETLRVARDVEELDKGKSSPTMEQRARDNLKGSNSPHHQRPFNNVSNYRFCNMPVQNSHPFYEGGYQGRPQVSGGRRGGLGGRGYYRPQEEYQRHELWHDDNFYEDYGDNPNVGQKEDTPKVAFKDHSKPKVEEKEKLITNPTRCFKCNGVGHIAINCPTKRTLGFSEDLNGWIEKS